MRDPAIVSWPNGPVGRGELRHQYAHAIDVWPTVAELLHIAIPDVVGDVAQLTLDGRPMGSVLASADAPEVRTSQYYECWGSRAYYEDGWKVVTDHVNQLTHAERDLIEGSSDFDADHWALYDTRTDLAENHDRSAEQPDLRDRLVAGWHAEAERNGVLPLTHGVHDRLEHLFLPWPSGSTEVVLAPGERSFEDNTPVLALGFTIRAELGAPLAAHHDGVLAEQGDVNGGWAWWLGDGTLTFAVAFVSEHLTRLAVPAPDGATSLAVVGRPRDGGVDLVAEADGTAIGSGRLPHEWPGLWTPNSSATLLAGIGRPLAVCDGYDPRRGFSGSLERLVVRADGGAGFADVAHQVDVAFRSQ